VGEWVRRTRVKAIYTDGIGKVRRLSSYRDLVIPRNNPQPCTPQNSISLQSRVCQARCQFYDSFANSVPLSQHQCFHSYASAFGIEMKI
jgi:hypothetical protein